MRDNCPKCHWNHRDCVCTPSSPAAAPKPPLKDERPGSWLVYHSCFTGDCPHDRANDCLNSVKESIEEEFKSPFDEEAIPPGLSWQRHVPERKDVYDGDVFLVALQVENKETGRKYWEIEKLRVSCDSDGAGEGFFELIYADCADSTPYDAWTWDDFEFSIKLHFSLDTSIQSPYFTKKEKS